MSLPELVRAFNSLPRSQKTPSGLVENHWQFAVQHVTLNTPGDLVHLVNPDSRFVHCEGPAQILSCTSAIIQADIVLPMLLKAFVTKLGIADPQVPSYGPWSWGTNDGNLATALEERMKAAGVREELCTIEVGDEKKIAIQQEEWTRFLGMMEEKARPKCAKCGQGAKDEAHKLMLCSSCKCVHYCSKVCQKLDWKQHKGLCASLAKSAISTGTTTTTIRAGSGKGSPSAGVLEYFQTIAPDMPEAQALAREIGLRLFKGQLNGIIYPIRRLVVTGKDTPENFVKLLGPNEKNVVAKVQKDMRMEVLLQPPRGSPMHAMAKKLDENCPLWAPREPSATEKEQLNKVRAMQELIRRHMGSRSMSNINTNDMREILVKNFGVKWDEALPIYMDAINAMDQGVPAP